MDWNPISEVDLWTLINEAEGRMTVSQARLWEAIRVQPQKWNEMTYGMAGGGFWVVGIIGETVIWYNDIEDGFNRSRYVSLGTISEYLCNQDALEFTLQQVLTLIESGGDIGPRCSPPKAGSFNAIR